jgi:hypothetical protein
MLAQERLLLCLGLLLLALATLAAVVLFGLIFELLHPLLSELLEFLVALIATHVLHLAARGQNDFDHTRLTHCPEVETRE